MAISNVCYRQFTRTVKQQLMEYGTRFQLEFIEAYEDLDKVYQRID